MNAHRLVVVVVVALSATGILAQRGLWGERLGGPSQAVHIGLASTTVRNGNNADSVVASDYTGAVYGLTYARSYLLASVLYGPGRDGSDVDYLDLSIYSWGEFNLTGGGEAATQRVAIPVGLYTEYHRFSLAHAATADPESDDGFSNAAGLTMLGLGTGIHYTRRFGSTRLDLRTDPVLGIASGSLGGTGHSRLLDASALLAFDDVFGRVGFQVGYAFREQVWRVDATSFSTGRDDAFYNYGETRHTLRVGVAW